MDGKMHSNGELFHYGVGHDKGGHSGRYPWGSGEDPYQREGGLRRAIQDCKEQGFSEVEIAHEFGFKSTTELRRRVAVEKMEERNIMYHKCSELKDQGYNNTEIAKKLGLAGESTVRSYLNPRLHEKNVIGMQTANMLKEEIDKHGTTDVGGGMAARLGISDGKLESSLILLERQGYKIQNIPVRQAGTGKNTTVRVIVPPDQTWGETVKLVNNEGKIHVVDDPYSEDGGRTWESLEPPVEIKESRVLVKLAEQGTPRDGLIEIRPGVEDLDMGRNQYCQVRIGVEGHRYMKGMAIYNPDIPKGYDIIYNTNKSSLTKAFKPMKDDPNNPFGSKIKDNEYDEEGNLLREVGQRHYIDKNGDKQLSAINIIRESGDWAQWKKTLSSQMLSKQSVELAERQLNLAYEKKLREYKEIQELTNPAIKKKLLQSFSDDCDSSAVHLKAAALPGQQSHVIIPFPEIKEGEVYAPNYEHGSTVSLIRFPHEGIYQIPTLKVNNKIPEARKLLGNAKDAIGINKAAADQLSGADFDGDTVLVIPNPGGKLIRSKKAITELRDFDTVASYGREAFKPEDATWTEVKKDKGFKEQVQMGMISNLITDMTLIGASDEELVRATKHSMVIIDSEKHDLNWRQSYIDNGIAELKKKYQGRDGKKGPGTLVSRSKNETRIPERKQFYESMIDKETGEIHWQETGRKKKVKDPETGKYVESDKIVLQKSSQMADAKDAFELSSGTEMENAYARYANKMKALGNESRRYMVNLENMKYSAQAHKEYDKEVTSILMKLNNAKKNRPLERKAQALCNAQFKAWLQDNPDADNDEQKKHKGLFLTEARKRMGSAKHMVKLTPREWEAVQAGAITHSRFMEVLNNTDIDVLKDYATPRESRVKLGKTEIALARSMYNAGNYTQAQIAEFFGVSVSALNKALNN